MEAEKTRIRNIVTPYLPSATLNAPRQPCPSDPASFHMLQPSYGQTNFYSVGLISEICRGLVPCSRNKKLIPKDQQMPNERRVQLLSKLERLDPPPYFKLENREMCRNIRSNILQSLKGKNRAVSSALPSSSSGTELGELAAVLQPSPRADIGLLSDGVRKSERDVLVFAFTKNNEPPVPIVATGFLLPEGDLAFVFLQPRILDYLGLELDASTGEGDAAPYQVYRNQFSQWVDEALDTLYSIPEGIPLIYRRRGVTETRDLEQYARLTVAHTWKRTGFATQQPSFSSPVRSSSALTSTALASRRSALLSSPSGASSSSLPTLSQVLRDVGIQRPVKTSSAGFQPSPSQSTSTGSTSQVTIKSEGLSLSDSAVLRRADRKGKRKARAPTPDDVIDLTQTSDGFEPVPPRKKKIKPTSDKAGASKFIPAHAEIIEIDSD